MKRSESFLDAIKGIERIVIVTHNYPDPDAIALPGV